LMRPARGRIGAVLHGFHVRGNGARGRGGARFGSCAGDYALGDLGVDRWSRAALVMIRVVHVSISVTRRARDLFFRQPLPENGAQFAERMPESAASRLAFSRAPATRKHSSNSRANTKARTRSFGRFRLRRIIIAVIVARPQRCSRTGVKEVAETVKQEIRVGLPGLG